MHVFESSAWLGQWRRSRLTEAELVTARCAQPGQMAVKGRSDRRQAGLWPAVGEGLSCGVSPGSAARPRSCGAELQAVSLGLGSRTPATVQGHVDGAVGTSLSGGSPPLRRGPPEAAGRDPRAGALQLRDSPSSVFSPRVPATLGAQDRRARGGAPTAAVEGQPGFCFQTRSNAK